MFWFLNYYEKLQIDHIDNFDTI